MSGVKSYRTMASEAMLMLMCMHIADFADPRTKADSFCACVLSKNLKSVWNCVSMYAYMCASLPRDPPALQLAWPQGYVALSFSGALDLWQLSRSCATFPGTQQDVTRSNLSSAGIGCHRYPWDDSGIVSLSLEKCNLSAKSGMVLKAEMCMSGWDECDPKGNEGSRGLMWLCCIEEWFFFSFWQIMNIFSFFLSRKCQIFSDFSSLNLNFSQVLASLPEVNRNAGQLLEDWRA